MPQRKRSPWTGMPARSLKARPVPKRTRAKIRRRLKRRYGNFHPSRPVPRRCAAYVSGTAIYRTVYDAEREHARFLATEPAERPPRPKAPRVRSGGVYRKRAELAASRRSTS